MFCGIAVALKAPDTFGQYLGLGLVTLLGLQALINIGVVTAWLPTKGLPLPFISFGGSNLVMSMTCIGLLLNICRFSGVEAPREDQEFFAKRSTVS